MADTKLNHIYSSHGKTENTKAIMKRSLAKQRSRGAVLAEGTAAILLTLPIVFVLFYFVYEASYYLYLKNGVDSAARVEARWLAINFNSLCQENGNSAANYANWKNSKVRVGNCVVDGSQITNGTIDSTGAFVTTAPTVTFTSGCINGVGGQGAVAVQVTYPGNQAVTKLASWPNPSLYLWGKSLLNNGNPITITGTFVCDIEP